MLIKPVESLTAAEKAALEKLRNKTDKLIADCFDIERLSSDSGFLSLRPEFYEARKKIEEAKHQLLRQLGWRT